MDEISRREFIKLSAATSAAAAFLPIAAREMQMNPLGMPIGSQTYPHRQRIKDGDFAGLCRDMKALGIDIIELCSPAYEEFASLTDAKLTRTIIEDHGLTCPSAHFELSELRDGLPRAIAWAHEIGMTQIGTATLNGKTENGVAAMDDVKRAADEYDKIGEAASNAGVQAFLHDERFEMARV